MAAAGLVGIAAPHVSPEGGWRCYQAAYGILGPEHRGRTVVILGTSHYGEPYRFGLTRKPFLTPLGEAEVDVPLVDELVARGGDAMVLEDYCHAVEHSIEFQVVFLQHVLGPDVRLLPVLCGPFAGATRDGGRPEDDPGVARVIDTLGNLAAREGDRLLWVLGVDMAHVGRRYGDDLAAKAQTGPLVEVEARDRLRCEALGRGDAGAFWDLLRRNGDDLRWCGASPFYTFLRRSRPAVRAARYEQWNIDEQSVVSFDGLAFPAEQLRRVSLYPGPRPPGRPKGADMTRRPAIACALSYSAASATPAEKPLVAEPPVRRGLRGRDDGEASELEAAGRPTVRALHAGIPARKRSSTRSSTRSSSRSRPAHWTS